MADQPPTETPASDDQLLHNAGRASAVHDLAVAAGELGKAAVATAEAVKDETAARLQITKRYDRMIARATLALVLMALAVVGQLVLGLWNHQILDVVRDATSPAAAARGQAVVMQLQDETDCRVREALAGLPPKPATSCIARHPEYRAAYADQPAAPVPEAHHTAWWVWWLPAAAIAVVGGLLVGLRRARSQA